MLGRVRNLTTIIRNIHTNSTLYVRNRKRQNPGIQLRASLLRQGEETDLSVFEEDPEFDPDSDFFDAHKSHRQYEKEMKGLKEKISYWRVRDKYFKVKLPNLLTWAEKEHIRYLHESNPEDWTPEAIVEKFPIDSAHIQKLLKAKWHPKGETKASKHDESVSRNWDLLKDGKFNLPEQVLEHLMKFKDRQVDQKLLKFLPRTKLTDTTRTKGDEFLNIIASSKKYQNTEADLDPYEHQRQVKYMDETIKRNLPSKARRTVTLEEFKRLTGERDDVHQKQLPAEIRTTEEVVSLEPQVVPASTGIIRKSAEKSEIDDDLMKEISMAPIRDKIRIPKRLWRKGATYKFGDCFYHDDGELLYRVPGLTKSRQH